MRINRTKNKANLIVIFVESHNNKYNILNTEYPQRRRTKKEDRREPIIVKLYNDFESI